MMVGWMDTLLSYDFDIIHIPGVQNVLPDALSRLFPPEKGLAGSDSTVRDKISPFFGFFAMPRRELNLGLRFADETFARKLDKIIGVT
ncbi:hypothetical protein G6F62_015248 [Rhizopus arrhizus]|uniref:Uncharacterized protein n=1 Tax=Rhizopus oryzae TaxID=64495 RepID=A0A9P6WS79_RHIOR|nr:hypothetical protein G6F23_014892 [Rhizopus arrhizus]KAG0737797.1 hypothetical protein G6F24_017812 [Rhizopus arrhizus]KAG0773762.1 hypothetical protein G6F21_014291 [Rhizopus arrhizus]KAG0804579.1 hypothetical protein G6F19_014152 [Rhizopus arrhizus]KAG0869330.1 hypothetical protein G6F34_014183 [Rhizopus arrhizus]